MGIIIRIIFLYQSDWIHVLSFFRFTGANVRINLQHSPGCRMTNCIGGRFLPYPQSAPRKSAKPPFLILAGKAKRGKDVFCKHFPPYRLVPSSSLVRVYSDQNRTNMVRTWYEHGTNLVYPGHQGSNCTYFVMTNYLLHIINEPGCINRADLCGYSSDIS